MAVDTFQWHQGMELEGKNLIFNACIIYFHFCPCVLSFLLIFWYPCKSDILESMERQKEGHPEICIIFFLELMFSSGENMK